MKFVDAVQALVRPTVTLMFSGAACYGWVTARLSDDAFLGLAGVVIGFWFQTRLAANGRPAVDAPPPPTPPAG